MLISDLLMPDGDGYQLIRDIRQLDRAAGRTTPAAALTALARTDDRRSALTAGYQMHLAKPIDPSELVSTVERLAQRRRRHPVCEQLRRVFWRHSPQCIGARCSSWRTTPTYASCCALR